MTLHEQYAELLRRGMPEHPNLIFDNRGTNGFVPYIGCNLTHDYIARDLIEAWAERWWLDLADPDYNRQLCAWNNVGRGATVYNAETRDCTSSWTEDWVWVNVGQGATKLDAILAATEHLANP